MILRIDSLDSYYGKSHILRNVSMEVDSGEIIGIFGRNGAGKTTLIESIVSTGPRVLGTIEFKGIGIQNERPERIFQMGVSWVPEERRVFSNLSVEDNLRTGLRQTPIGKKLSNLITRDKNTSLPDTADHEQLFRNIYSIFPVLEERKHQMSGTLSGGEQQMLAIGRAFISDPDMIMIDEPFEGLMPTLIPQIRDVIQQMRDENTSIVITEQNLSAALQITDKALVIENGEIVYQGQPGELEKDISVQKRYLGVNIQ